jgi:hypothetical protein
MENTGNVNPAADSRRVTRDAGSNEAKFRCLTRAANLSCETIRRTHMGLKDVFLDELRDMYSAENQLVNALPKLAQGATSPS